MSLTQISSRATSALAGSSLAGWFRTKEPRDRRIILGLCAVIGLTIVWLGVWQPINDWHTSQLERLNQAQNLLDWMKLNEAEARRVVKAPDTAGQRSVLPVITRSAQANGLKLNRLQPEANGVVSVVIQDQPFGSVMEWLQQLEENNGITVDNASIDQQGAPGKVNAQIRLR
ncbi:MAG: type II secretion system protein M [Proteobacteria bacterium]|nr:type II secretion system protein M [Pseudomonadota bacterium]